MENKSHIPADYLKEPVVCAIWSGGLESTLMIQQLLNDGKTVIAVYGEIKYCIEAGMRQHLQKFAIKKLTKYFKQKYPGKFMLHKFGITTDFRECGDSNDFIWGTDDHWAIFYATQVCVTHGLHYIWKSEYTSTFIEQIDVPMYPGKGIGKFNVNSYSGELDYFVLAGLRGYPYPPPRVVFPAGAYAHTGHDRFNSRKELYDELDPYLQKYVRSCNSVEWFCGECYPCLKWKHYGLYSEKPEDLEE